MRTLLTIVLGVSMSAFAAGCGGDDTVTPGPQDSGHDVNVGDTGPGPDAGDGGNKADANDSGCQEFSAFVIDLVNNHTNATEQPVPTEGRCFTDNQDPKAFDSLFP